MQTSLVVVIAVLCVLAFVGLIVLLTRSSKTSKLDPQFIQNLVQAKSKVDELATTLGTLVPSSGDKFKLIEDPKNLNTQISKCLETLNTFFKEYPSSDAIQQSEYAITFNNLQKVALKLKTCLPTEKMGINKDEAIQCFPGTLEFGVNEKLKTWCNNISSSPSSSKDWTDVFQKVKLYDQVEDSVYTNDTNYNLYENLRTLSQKQLPQCAHDQNIVVKCANNSMPTSLECLPTATVITEADTFAKNWQKLQNSIETGKKYYCDAYQGDITELKKRVQSAKSVAGKTLTGLNINGKPLQQSTYKDLGTNADEANQLSCTNGNVLTKDNDKLVIHKSKLDLNNVFDELNNMYQSEIKADDVCTKCCAKYLPDAAEIIETSQKNCDHDKTAKDDDCFSLTEPHINQLKTLAQRLKVYQITDCKAYCGEPKEDQKECKCEKGKELYKTTTPVGDKNNKLMKLECRYPVETVESEYSKATGDGMLFTKYGIKQYAYA